MKRFYSYLMVMAALVFSGGKAMAQSVNINDVTYAISGDYATVTGYDYNGTNADVEILATVEINGVQYSVKEIGSSAFYKKSDLVSVILPEGIKTIGYQAFYNCPSLSSVTLPKGLETIGNYAFAYCSKLTEVKFPAELKNIGESAFRNCTSLTTVNIPEGVTTIGDYAFYGCSKVISITLPKSITSINNYVFCDCSSLTSIVIPEGVTSIGSQAFYSCKNLTSVTFPKSLSTIGNSAFNYCSTLETIVLPEEMLLTSVGSSAFSNIKATLPVEGGIRYLGTCAYELSDRSLTEYAIKEGTKSICPSLFSSCTKMTNVTIPSSVVFVGESAFYNCTSLPVENGIRYADCYAVEVTDKTLTDYTLKEGVRFLGNSLFSGCKSVTTLTIPEGVTSIGNSTFNGCTALTSVTIPNGVTSIGNRAFYDCSALSTIALSQGLTSLGEYAFYNCYNLKAISIPSGVNRIENYTFSNCESLTSATLPENLEYLGNNAFYGCSSLTSINIPKGITTIPNEVFRNCSSLTAVTIPEGVTSIGDYAFYSCSSLRSFEWPSTLTNVGSNNLYKETLEIVSHADIPPTIQNGCSNRVLYVPEGCGTAYKEVYPDNIIVDGNGTELTLIITEAGTLGEEILKEVTNLSDVNRLTISGTLNDKDLECLKNSTPNLVSVDLTRVNMKNIPNSFFYDKKSISKVVLPNDTETIGDQAFRGCTRLREITLPESLTAINSYAFYGSGLSSITIPAGVTSIGSYAFDDCYYLESANIPAGITRIGNYTFSDCQRLKSIEIPESVTNIGQNAFYGCSRLTSVSFSKNITTIENYAFNGCSSLQAITLPQELITIGSYAFRGCTSLTSLEISNKVATIYSSAFSDCDNIETVTMDGELRVIESSAFSSCDRLHTVTLPNTLIQCGSNIFSGCNNLQTVTSQALFPPTVNNSIAPNKTCVLYAPEWTLEKYKLATGWSGFSNWLPIPGVYPMDIAVYKEESLSIPDNGLPQDYNPNIKLAYEQIDSWNYYVGKLTLRGDMPLNLANFEMLQTRNTSSMTSLINNGNVTADSVVTKISMSANTWHYLTFPYDVKVSDIITEGGNWIICYYDGEARAQADFGNTWKTVPFDSILHAGKGYIWHSTTGNFTVPAVANAHRNDIFAKEARPIQLIEHAASTTANYGWNLIGNPYPCYYDTRFMEFTSPITVRNGNSYAAYSPVDDSYILMPNEAFFVQCSADNNVAVFTLDGRQTNNTAREITSAPSMKRGATTDRCVLNLYLESNSYADHTRLVVNEKASMAYEISCDAAKFMSDDTTVPQLFTLIDEERMAINERPLADGKAALGIYIGVAGTHTISLDTKATDAEVILIDKLAGIETDLTTFSYDFTAEAGTYTDRFEIVMKRTGETGITETTTGGVKVVAMPGVINVTNATAPINVYNAAGALVTTKSGNAVTFEVEPGVYVVKVGSEAHKISVVK